MTAPWQLRHDMIHADEAALARTSRRAAQLADLRAGTEPGGLRLRLTAAWRTLISRIPLPELFPPTNRPANDRDDLKVREIAPFVRAEENAAEVHWLVH